MSNRKLIGLMISEILERNFPESIHEDILEAIGMSSKMEVITRRVRDPKFRSNILKAYGQRCAVCGFDVMIGNLSVAIEAAHIKWRQVNGPDTESNGIALCVMHHLLIGILHESDPITWPGADRSRHDWMLLVG